MWDKPDVLNAIAGLLFAAALLLAVYGGVHYVVRLPVFPLREVRIDGELAHVTREQLETLARREVKGNFFTLDLGEARAAFAALPWVRRAEVRRQWPDRLDVALEEHVPLARWGNAALVNTYGEVFTAAFEQPFDGAPASDRESGAAPSSAGVASVSGVTSPKGARRRAEEGPLWGSDPADAHRAGSDAPMAGSTVASPQVGPLLRVTPAPVPPSDGAPASSEQGSRLRDANVRESGAALSSAGVASVSGVTSPKGAPVPPSDGAPVPLFIGPPESAKEIAIQYGYFRRRLATIGQVPVEVRVSPRRAWQVRLASGLTLRLGRERIEARLDRYIAVHDRTISRLRRKLDYVDLRYPNGFAVRIPELRPESQHQRRAGKAARDPTQAKGNR